MKENAFEENIHNVLQIYNIPEKNLKNLCQVKPGAFLTWFKITPPVRPVLPVGLKNRSSLHKTKMYICIVW